MKIKSSSKRQPVPKAARRKLPGKSAATAAGVLAAAAVLNEARSATNPTVRAPGDSASPDRSTANSTVDELEKSELQKSTGSFAPAAGEPSGSVDAPAATAGDVSIGETESDLSGDAIQAEFSGDGDQGLEPDALTQSVEGDTSAAEMSQVDSAEDTDTSSLQLAQAVPGSADAAAEAVPGSAAAGGAAAEVGAVSATAIGMGPILGGLAAVVVVGGAGGGGGSSLSSVVSAAAKTTVSKGTVIDGPVKNATIFYDENNDGKLNGLEKSTVTNADGSYTLTGYTQTAVGKFVVLPGGVDTFSGKSVGMLTAKEGADGSTVITPLTTLLANTNLSQADLAAALGLTGLTVNLETFDPFAAMKSTDPTMRALGEKVFTAGQQVMTIMQASMQQSGSTGGNASDPAAQYAALNSVASAISVAIHTVDNLSATEIAGGGLMKTIATFAIAAGNGIDVASFENNANALSSINAALAGNTTAQAILGAVDSVNQSIATAFVDLSSKIAAGGAALADAEAITALSQTGLGTRIHALITTGVSSGLELLSSATGLAGLVDTVSAQIEAGGVGNTAALPQILTVAFSDAIAHIGTPYADADAVLVKVADADLASLVTHAGDFHAIHVDLLDVLDSSLTLTETQAGTLIAAGLSFADDNAITVQAEGTNLSTSLKDLQKLGVDNVLVDGVASAGAGHDITLSLGAGTLATDSITTFAAADVVLNIADTQVTEVAGLASSLHTAGIDFIGADDGTLTLTDSDLHTILNSGLTFASEAVVTAQVSDAGLTTLVADVNAAALLGVNEGVDFIHMADGTAVITETQASSLIAAGIEFSASDTVTVQAEGTHLSTSLKDLQKLGVDNVLIDGTAAAAEPGHDLALVLGSGTLSDVGIPQFDAAASVKLGIADGQVSEVASHAAPLVAAGIDYIAGIDGSLTVGGVDLHSIVSSGLVFASGTEVTAAVSDAGLTTMIQDVDTAASHGTNLGVDIVEMADNTASITEAQAVSLAQAGVEFAAADKVDMQADGTHVATSLKDLHDLGVDHVTVDAVAAAAKPRHDLVLALGDVANGPNPAAELLAFLETYAGHTLFNNSADVALELSPTIFAAIDNAPTATHDAIVTDLVNLGVDEVKVIGTDTEHDLHAM